MKFSVAKEDLVQAISKLQNVVAVRPALPLLANFMIEAKGSELIFTATDLTVGIRCIVPAQVEEEGITTLPARRFFQLIREITSNQLQLSTNEQEMTQIHAGNSRFKILGMSRSEFPQLPDFDDEKSFEIDQKSLKAAFYKTSFAVSKEDSRYVLTGVLMHLDQNGAVFVGTDGKRLAKAPLAINNCSLKGHYILPAKAVDEVLRCLDDSEKKIKVYVESDKVAFDLGSILLMTRLVSGEYPDFQRVIPSETKIEVHLHREELISLLRQVALFTAESSQSARFTLGDSELILSASSVDVGDCRVAMPLHYQGPRFDIAFNPNYFLDILRHSSDDAIKLGLIDPFNPGLISDSSGALFVLMPMRLSEPSNDDSASSTSQSS
jgi:DNA polymerase-3 subunit beta